MTKRRKRRSQTSSLNKSLQLLYDACCEEQVEVDHCGQALHLLQQMLRNDTSSIEQSYKHAKNILNASVLTSNYDAMQARLKQR